MNNTEIIERMKRIADMKEDQELAQFFGISKSTLANWKGAKDFSMKRTVEFCSHFKCDLHWLITGDTREEKIEPIAAMLLSGFMGLSDAQKLQAVTFIGNLASGGTATPAKTDGINQTASGNGVNVNSAGRVQYTTNKNSDDHTIHEK